MCSSDLGLTVSAGGPYNGTTGQPVAFSASVAGGSGGVAFTWNFGDGTTQIGQNVSKIFQAPGTYTVTVTANRVSTGDTGTAQTTATIQAQAQALSVTISGPTQGGAGNWLTFSASASGSFQGTVNYSWNFGDGTPSVPGPSVTHTFSQAGSFTVTVNAVTTGNPSATSSATQTVVVSASGPSATYAAGWNLVGAPAGTTFTAAAAPLYTLNASGSYDSVPASEGVIGGRGYWAYFAGQTTVQFAGAGTNTATVSAPAGQYVMIGNPSATQNATVTGADTVYTYDAAGDAYAASNVLKPGAGAWALSNAGGTITITATP